MLGALKERLRGSRTEDRQLGSTPFSLQVSRGRELLFSDRFTAGEVVIGGGSGADVIVADLEPEEAVLLRLETHGVSGMIYLSALAPEVEVPGRTVRAGDPVPFLNRAEFRIGGYDLTVVFHAPTGWLADVSSLPVVLFLGAGLTGLAAIVSGHGGSPRVPDAPVESPSVRELGPSRQARQTDVAADQLRRKLVAANLLPPVRVALRGESLVLTGVLTADERARLLDLLAASRATLPDAIELEVASDSDVSSFVRSIALAPQLYLLGRDNKRYEPGHRLPDGGLLESITATGLVIDRDGIKEKTIFNTK